MILIDTDPTRKIPGILCSEMMSAQHLGGLYKCQSESLTEIRWCAPLLLCPKKAIQESELSDGIRYVLACVFSMR